MQSPVKLSMWRVGGVVTVVVVEKATGGRSSGGKGYREHRILSTKKKINGLGNSTGEQ